MEDPADLQAHIVAALLGSRPLFTLLPDVGGEVARSLGIWFEHPQWTRSWLHCQIVPPASGNRFFVPYADLVKNPPTCIALPEQAAANCPVFDFREAA